MNRTEFLSLPSAQKTFVENGDRQCCVVKEGRLFRLYETSRLAWSGLYDPALMGSYCTAEQAAEAAAKYCLGRNA